MIHALTADSGLTDRPWLNGPRLIAYSRILLAYWILFVTAIPFVLPHMQVARDFAAFWTAGRLALEGHAADAYGEPAREALAALFGPGNYPAFFYPPTALLLWAPFATMAFIPAVVAWLVATGIAYVAAIRRLARTATVTPALACPAVLVCALYGQNSLLSAAIFAAVAMTLDTAPMVAGALAGVLVYKPQLAVLVPFAFAAAGRWRALAAAAATAIGLVAVSAAVFGVETWRAFAAALPAARDWNERGVAGFGHYPSVFAAMRDLGFTANPAWAAQTLAALPAIFALLRIARRRPGGGAEIAMLVAATGFCLPFIGQYELALFVVPGAWLVADAARTGWRGWERWALVLLFISPVPIVLASALHVPLGPLALAALAALVYRRAAAAGGGEVVRRADAATQLAEPENYLSAGVAVKQPVARPPPTVLP